MAKKTSNKATRSSAVRSAAVRKNVLGARNNREKKMMIAIAILAVALIGTIGVAVAAFSTDLYIRGTAIVASSTWDVHFQNLQSAVKNGTYVQEITAPTIEANDDGVAAAAIKTYEVKLKEPGDSIEYDFEIINAGDMDAEIAALSINTGSGLSCSSAAGAEVASTICSKLNYTLTYTDTNTPVAVGDELPTLANGTNVRPVRLKLELDPSTTSTQLPNKDVTIGGLAVIISYAQADN